MFLSIESSTYEADGIVFVLRADVGPPYLRINNYCEMNAKGVHGSKKDKQVSQDICIKLEYVFMSRFKILRINNIWLTNLFAVPAYWFLECLNCYTKICRYPYLKEYTQILNNVQQSRYFIYTIVTICGIKRQKEF